MSNNKQGHIFQSLRSVFLLLVMPGRKDPLHSWRCPQHSWRCHLPSTAFSSYEVSYGRLYPMETSDSEWSDNGVHFLKKSFVVLQEGVQSIQWPKRPRLLIDKVDNLAKEAWQELTRRVVEEVGNDVQHSCKQHWKKGIAICGEWPKARILGRVFLGNLHPEGWPLSWSGVCLPGSGWWNSCFSKRIRGADVVSVMRFVKLRFAPSSRSFLGHRESHQNSWFLIHVTSL